MNTRNRVEIRLQEVIKLHADKTGETLTYRDLADRSEISRSSIESIASRPSYNVSLKAVEQLCAALDCDVNDLLVTRR